MASCRLVGEHRLRCSLGFWCHELLCLPVLARAVVLDALLPTIPVTIQTTIHRDRSMPCDNRTACCVASRVRPCLGRGIVVLASCSHTEASDLPKEEAGSCLHFLCWDAVSPFPKSRSLFLSTFLACYFGWEIKSIDGDIVLVSSSLPGSWSCLWIPTTVLTLAVSSIPTFSPYQSFLKILGCGYTGFSTLRAKFISQLQMAWSFSSSSQ